MAKEIKDLTASVSQRLRNYAKEHGEDLQSVLVRYGAERFLYRLSKSEHKDRFLLKGAALFTVWFDQPHRPTKDIDLLGFGLSDITTIEKAIREICAIEYNDGLEFLSDSVKGETIREDLAYQGIRVKLIALLGNIKIPLQIDIGTGDAVTPGPETAQYPALLDFPRPKLKVYPKETVVAEKFEAMVRFGMANGRMKDFWDLRYMIAEFEFDGALLQKAIRSTFERRNTPFPESLPVALTDIFVNDRRVAELWTAFVTRNRLKHYSDLREVIDDLRRFFGPIVESGASGKAVMARWIGEKWK